MSTNALAAKNSFAPTQLIRGLRERIPDGAVWATYVVALVLGLAYGMALAFTPPILAERGFAPQAIGTLATFFGLGLVVFAIPAGYLLKRIGAKTLAIVSVAGYSVTLVAFAFLPSYRDIAIVRFFDGAFSVSAWLSFETLILERATQANKAFTTSIYTIATGVGYAIGALMARALTALSPSEGFLLASTIGAGAALLGTLLYATTKRSANNRTEAVTLDGPPAEAHAPLPMWDLLKRMRASAFATFATGFFQSSAVLFLPIYFVRDRGISDHDAMLVVPLTCIGMLIFSNPLGRLGDRIGHLKLMIALAFVGTGALLLCHTLAQIELIGLCIFIGGGVLTSIPPLSLALQGHLVPKHAYAQATGVFNTSFAAGLLVGPLLSGFAFERFGGFAVLLLMAALWISFAIFALFVRRDDPNFGLTTASVVVP